MGYSEKDEGQNGGFTPNLHPKETEKYRKPFTMNNRAMMRVIQLLAWLFCFGFALESIY